MFGINTFVTLEEAERVIAKFIDDYNRGWILHRLHLQSPIEYRLNTNRNTHRTIRSLRIMCPTAKRYKKTGLCSPAIHRHNTQPSDNVSDGKIKKIIVEYAVC